MEMLSPGEYKNIINYLEKNQNEMYISKYIRASYLREKTLLRYLLFHNNLIAFGKYDRGELCDLIIIENNNALLDNVGSMKIMATSINKKDMDDVYLMAKDIYDKVYNFKIFTDTNETSLTPNDFYAMGFKLDAVINKRNIKYYDFGMYYE